MVEMGRREPSHQAMPLTPSHLFQLNPRFQRQELKLPDHCKERGRD